MYSMNRKGNSTGRKSSCLEIKPAFWIALVISSLSITCSPDTVMLVGVSDNFMHIARVEVTIKEDMRFPRL